MIYAAYYRKDATFREDGHLSKRDLLSGKTHALIVWVVYAAHKRVA